MGDNFVSTICHQSQHGHISAKLPTIKKIKVLYFLELLKWPQNLDFWHIGRGMAVFVNLSFVLVISGEFFFVLASVNVQMAKLTINLIGTTFESRNKLDLEKSIN